MFLPTKVVCRPINNVTRLFLFGCAFNDLLFLHRASALLLSLNLIHNCEEVFRGLRRNIRGQHINFYSQVIHKAKKFNKI